MQKSRFSWAWIARSVLLRKGQVVRLLLLTLIVYGAGIVFPITIQRAVDTIVAGRSGIGLIGLAAVAAAAITVETFAGRSRRRLVNDFGLFLERRIARLTFSHMLRSRVDTQALQAGDTLNKFGQTETIVNFVLHFLPTTVFDAGSALLSLAVMVYYDAEVTAGLVIAAPLFAYVITRRLNRIHDLYETFFAMVGRQQNLLAETVNGIATVKALAVENDRMRQFGKTVDAKLDRLREQIETVNAYQLASQLASRALTLLVVGLGCWRLQTGHITVGDLLALQLLAARISGPLLSGGDIFSLFQKTNSAIGQIDSLLQAPRERAGVQPPVRTLSSSAISVRGLSLTYPGAARPALAGVDLDLPERGMVALVGRNGSGKSTLIQVLLGMQRDYAGSVTIGGRDLRDYDPRWLRTRCGVVNQDTVLFAGTIRDNLASGRPVSDGDLRAALRFADALAFVDALPDGLDTEINAGNTLSGGQRQRLAIARALIRDPRIAFFDEPGAFLDAEAAVSLERRLNLWARDRLIVLVTHHLVAARAADRIVVLDAGRCVGMGTHRDLLANVPDYAMLWAHYNRRDAGELAVG